MIRYLLGPLMKKYRKLIISMIAVSVLGISLMVGLGGAYSTLERSLNDYVRDYRYADAVITTDLAETVPVEQLRKIYGVKQVNSRLAGDFHVRKPDGRIVNIRAFTYATRDFQQFFVWDQNQSAEYPNVSLDFQFAKQNGISAGDTLEVLVDGEYETVCVGRIISSAECLSFRQNTFSMGESPDFGFAFMPVEMLYDTEYFGQANQILLRFDDWADGYAALEEAEKILGEDAVLDSYLLQDSGVQKRIDFNLGPLEKLSVLVPSLFFASMVAVVSLFMTQIIRQSRRTIGILRACGFEQRTIRKLFRRMTLVITLIGCVIGIALGGVIMYVVSGIYSDFFPLPQLHWQIPVLRGILAVVVTIAAGQLSAWISTRMISRIQPSEAMSRQSPSAASLPKPVAFLLRKVPPAVKVGITSIFRNRKRFVFSVFCIALSIMLILSAVAFNESKNGILKHLFDDRIRFESQMFFREAPTDAQLQTISKVPGVTKLQSMNYYYLTARAGDRSEDIIVVSLPEGSDALGVYGLKGERLDIPAEGVILEKHTAHKLGIRAGDSVVLDGVSLPVAALSDQSMNRMSCLSASQAQALGEPKQYSLVCCIDPVQEKVLLETITDMDSYTQADFTHMVRSGLEATFATYSIGVRVLIGFSVLLGVIIVYNTMQTNLLEQKKELSVMRAIGFQVSEISMIWLIQSGLQFLLSCLVGLPAGVFVAKYALNQMTTDTREYPFSNSLNQYIITVVLVLAYVLVSHWAAMRMIRKWDIAENTKEKE